VTLVFGDDVTTYLQRQGSALHEGVRVYLERALREGAEEPLRIDLEGFGPWRRLWVSGIEPLM
jgi:hypothetical protein